MSKMLVATEKPITKVFSQDYVFQIPDYQRPYAWTTEQARELFEDVTGFMRSASGQIGEMPPYFLGSIVLIQPEGKKDADVVDGQQRLTTITLLLSVIRHYMTANRDSVTKLIYEKADPVAGTSDHYRLSLRARDSDFFRKYVQIDGGIQQLTVNTELLSDSQKNLRGNAQLFAQLLGDYSQDQLLRLAQFIATRCYLVVVATPDQESAFRIFSVLNSRGLNLAATDILKADVIGKLPDGKREAYSRKWEDIEEALGRDGFGELFSHIRMVYRKMKPQGTLLKEFRDHVPDIARPTTLMDKVVEPMAAAYGQITTAGYESMTGADAVNESLRWLNRLEFSDWIPPSLLFMTDAPRTTDVLARYYKDLERLAYSMLIRRAGINERIDRFGRLTAAIEQNLELFVDDSVLQLTHEEQQETCAVLDGPFYELLAARARSTLLLRLDALLASAGAVYDISKATVEHVLPQNPATGSEWLNWIPDESRRAAWVHRLGNLALLDRPKNSAASNFDFSTKKAAYFTKGGVTPFAITTQVLTKSEWDTAAIEALHQERLRVLATHWRLANCVSASV